MIEWLTPLAQNNIPVVIGSASTLMGSFLLAKYNTKKDFDAHIRNKALSVWDAVLDSGNITMTEYIKCKNLKAIAAKADEIRQSTATPQGEPAEKSVSFEWFNHFVESTGNVTDEDMQNYWAKLLAGEVKEPGSFSRRTLDVLSKMSKEDAEYFERMASTFFYYSNAGQNRPIAYLRADSETLSNISVAQSTKIITILSFPNRRILYSSNLYLTHSNQEACELQLNASYLTQSGTELLRLIHYKEDESFILSRFRKIRDDNIEMKLRIIDKRTGKKVN